MTSLRRLAMVEAILIAMLIVVAGVALFLGSAALSDRKSVV